MSIFSFKKPPTSNWLVRASLAVNRRAKLVLVACLVIVLASGFIYERLIVREGFPPLTAPLSSIKANYFVDDVVRVDRELAQPLSRALSGVDQISEVNTTTTANNLVATVVFEGSVEAESGPEIINQALAGTAWPAGVEIEVEVVDVFAFLGSYDLLVAVYQPENQSSVGDLQTVAIAAARQLESDPAIATATMIPLIVADNQTPGLERQINFNEIGLINSDRSEFNFYPSVLVGVNRDRDQIDVLELSELVKARLPEIDLVGSSQTNHQAVVVADFAESINRQIGSLETNLLTGLVAITIISLLLISWRAAVVTALFMISVILVSVGILYLLGISLNTITLFGLLLVLGLFVDDATIVVEAIETDKKARPGGGWRADLKTAFLRVVSPSWAGTLTTILVFLPLLFIAGIIGEVLRILPITIVIALLVSFVLSVTLIPTLTSWLLGWDRFLGRRLDRINPLSGSLRQIGQAAAWLPRQLTIEGRRRRGQWLLLASLIGGSLIILLSFGLGSRVSFDIFPMAKDRDVIHYQLEFPPGYDIDRAEAVTKTVQAAVVETIGRDNYDRLSYAGLYSLPDNRTAAATVTLIPRTQRRIKSPQIVKNLQMALDQVLAVVDDRVRGRAWQSDPGPPPNDYQLSILIRDDRPDVVAGLATVVADDLAGADFKIGGQTVQSTEVQVNQAPLIQRRDGRLYLQVEAKFAQGTDSEILAGADDYIKTRFPGDVLSAAGLATDAVVVDFGQEADNNTAFASLGYIFPAAIVLIYILLVFQFRSFGQPFLMLLALPFALPGVMAFLLLTNTPFSFFVMIGLIGLTGIVVNNTILLMAAANQARSLGLTPAAAAAAAVSDRFRPLAVTTLTTMVALIPLVVNEPFWEPLAGVVMAGLISSTIFVVGMFPAIYLAAGYLWRQGRRFWRLWRSGRPDRNADSI